jgi:hypothetical protein
MMKMQYRKYFSTLSFAFVFSAFGSIATADDLSAHGVYFFGNCDVELEGDVVMNGDCYYRDQIEMGHHIYYFYDQPFVAGGEVKFKHMVVRYHTENDEVVEIAHENGDGIHYLMGEFRFDGDCYVSKRGKVCNHVYEAAD